MPVSKLAFFRYLLIDRMLRNKFKKYPNMDEILEACKDKFGVKSISTIEKDLKAMRIDFNAPISYHKTLKGYYYTDTDFKLLSVNLSEDHLLALSFVENWLEDFKTIPIFHEFSDAVDKVLDGLEITRSFSKELKEVGNFIQIDKSSYYKNSKILSELIKLISDKKVIHITYQKFGAIQPKSYTIHPYLLKEFKSFWYLTGFVEEYKEVRTFGIDRIHSFESTEKTLMPPKEARFNAETFFKHCYGITSLNQRPERIVLSFAPWRGNYIKTQPLHPTQRILINNEDELRIELHLINNNELRNLILSFGSSIKVISPMSLKLAVMQELNNAIKAYQ